MRDYIILDLETNGLNSGQEKDDKYYKNAESLGITNPDDFSEIISLSILDMDGKYLYHSLVKPTTKLSQKLESIISITNDELSDKPLIKDVIKDIIPIIKDKIIICYNALFVLAILKHYMNNFEYFNPINYFDILEYSRNNHNLKNHSTSAILSYYNVDIDNEIINKMKENGIDIRDNTFILKVIADKIGLSEIDKYIKISE